MNFAEAVSLARSAGYTHYCRFTKEAGGCKDLNRNHSKPLSPLALVSRRVQNGCYDDRFFSV